MTKITQKSNDRLTLTSYPARICGVAFSFLAVFWIVAFLTDAAVVPSTYIIFNSVALLVIAIQNFKVTTFDKQRQTVHLSTTSVIGKRQRDFPLAEIRSISMSYGRGGSAKGGSIRLAIGDESFTIADSDISRTCRERNARVKAELADWLSVTHSCR